MRSLSQTPSPCRRQALHSSGEPFAPGGLPSDHGGFNSRQRVCVTRASCPRDVLARRQAMNVAIAKKLLTTDYTD